MDPAGVEMMWEDKGVGARDALPELLRGALLEYVAECRTLMRRNYQSLTTLLSPALHVWNIMMVFALDPLHVPSQRSRRTTLPAIATLAVYPQTETIAGEGEPADKLHVIVKGVVSAGSEGLLPMIECKVLRSVRDQPEAIAGRFFGRGFARDLRPFSRRFTCDPRTASPGLCALDACVGAHSRYVTTHVFGGDALIETLLDRPLPRGMALAARVGRAPRVQVRSCARAVSPKMGLIVVLLHGFVRVGPQAHLRGGLQTPSVEAADQLLTQARARLRGRGSEESSANAGTQPWTRAHQRCSLSLRTRPSQKSFAWKGRSPNSRRSSNVFTAGDDADTSEFEVDANEIEQALSSMGSQLVQQDMVRHTFGKSDHMNVDDGIVAKNVEVLRQEVASIMKHA